MTPSAFRRNVIVFQNSMQSMKRFFEKENVLRDDSIEENILIHVLPKMPDLESQYEWIKSNELEDLYNTRRIPDMGFDEKYNQRWYRETLAFIENQ